MSESELTLELYPWRDGRYTRVNLRGTIETVAEPREMRSLLKVLSCWSGAPVDIALCVDGTNSGSCWLEMWDDVLAHVRGRHLYQLRLLINRETLAAAVDPESDHDR